jgi:hypothetical protein
MHGIQTHCSDTVVDGVELSDLLSSSDTSLSDYNLHTVLEWSAMSGEKTSVMVCGDRSAAAAI